MAFPPFFCGLDRERQEKKFLLLTMVQKGVYLSRFFFGEEN